MVLVTETDVYLNAFGREPNCNCVHRPSGSAFRNVVIPRVGVNRADDDARARARIRSLVRARSAIRVHTNTVVRPIAFLPM